LCMMYHGAGQSITYIVYDVSWGRSIYLCMMYHGAGQSICV